jgi:sterol desaturase/sphingolipid hydroxylase (fatty acid hydroxylase superfamily)
MKSALMVSLLASTYAILFVLERAMPLRTPKARFLQRVWVNALVSILAFATAALLVRPAAAAMLEVADEKSFGLIPLLGLGGWTELIFTFLAMDLTFYYWHIANHRVPWLWRLHNVHHMDPDLDVTTGFRFHFGEVALSALFRSAQALLIGPSIAIYVVYEIAFQTHTLFHHSNMRLAFGLERLLCNFIVTPRVHGIHHSNYRDETNSNFGVVFIWWDRLHGTLRLDVPQSAITIGVPAYSRREDDSVQGCLTLPFLRQRDYWQFAGTERHHRDSSETLGDPRRLAA